MIPSTAAKQIEAQLNEERINRGLPTRTPEMRATVRTNLEQMMAWYLKPQPAALMAGTNPEGTG